MGLENVQKFSGKRCFETPKFLNWPLKFPCLQSNYELNSSSKELKYEYGTYIVPLPLDLAYKIIYAKREF